MIAKTRGSLTRRRKSLAAVAMLAIGMMLVMAGPASATVAVDDSFSVSTRPNGCGATDFVDYGPGAPGGGNNDDYLVIHDYCSDGHGVRGYAWLNGVYMGSKYNGNGLAGAAVIFDPFTHAGGTNVVGGDLVTIQACLVDGANDTTPFNCEDRANYSADG